MFDEEFEEERQLTVQDYLRILYRGRWYIIISFIVVMIVTAYLTYTAPYIYQAGATVLITSHILSEINTNTVISTTASLD